MSEAAGTGSARGRAAADASENANPGAAAPGAAFAGSDRSEADPAFGGALTADSTFPTSQAQLRKRIVAVQNDATISSAEKTRAIQDIMSSNTRLALANSLGDGDDTSDTNGSDIGDGVDNDVTQSDADPKKLSSLQVWKHVECTEKDKTPSFRDAENNILGCEHYMRSVKLQAHCCGKWFVCRFCHDEVSTHAIDRHKTKNMMCMHCKTTQPCGDKCSNKECGKSLARYYCSICKLWDDDPEKDIFHCNECGICRVGKGNGVDFYHCSKCNACISVLLKDKHRCIERNLESDCPICGEYLFTTTLHMIFMPCGHCIHHRCFQEHIQRSYYCPTCQKSLGDMTEYFERLERTVQNHVMPKEFETHKSVVFCNDCEQRSVTKYHFVYHMCEALLPEGQQNSWIDFITSPPSKSSSNSEESTATNGQQSPQQGRSSPIPWSSSPEGNVSPSGSNSLVPGPSSAVTASSPSSSSSSSSSKTTDSPSVSERRKRLGRTCGSFNTVVLFTFRGDVKSEVDSVNARFGMQLTPTSEVSDKDNKT